MGNIKLIIFLIIIVIMSTGCEKSNRLLLEDSEIEKSEAGPKDEILESVESAMAQIPSWVTECTEIGVFENIIRLGGDYRDRKDTAIDEYIIFPEGKVVTFIVYESGEGFKPDYQKEDMRRLISLIEESDITKDPESKDEVMLGRILLLNTAAEYIDVKIYGCSDDIYKLDIGHELAGELEDYDQQRSSKVYLKSSAVKDCIEGLMEDE